jgi:YaiO family outer membrane protein
VRIKAYGFAMIVMSFFKSKKKGSYLLAMFILLINTNSMASSTATEPTSATDVQTIPLSSTTPASNIKPMANTIEQIKSLRQEGNINAAESLALDYLKSHPTDVDAMLLLGLIAYQKANYTQAEVYFQKVLDQSPTYLDAKLGMIRVKIAQKKYQEASALIKALNKEAPDNPEVKDIQQYYDKALSNVSQQPSKTQPTTFANIQQLIKNKKLNAAQSLATSYLKDHPDDVDVVLLLGLIRYQQSDYAQAEKYFSEVLSKSPMYLDAKLGLIRIKIVQKQYQKAATMIKEVQKEAPNNTDVKDIQAFYAKSLKGEKKTEGKKKVKVKLKNKPSLIDQKIANGEIYSAMRMINQQLIIRPDDSTLLGEKAKIYFLNHLYSQAAYYAQKAVSSDPNNGTSKDILATIKEVDPHKLYGLDEIGIGSFNQYVSDITQVWDYSSLYYSHETPAGAVYARLNFAKRLKDRAPQGELEFIPVINPYLYLDLDATVANKPTLFPKYAVSMEAYGTIPTMATLSLGGNYNFIVRSIYYKKYTASLSKEFKNYWLSIRTNRYVPSGGHDSTLYIGAIRRYFGNSDCYLTLTLGYGKSPDLANLQAVNFIVIDNKFADLSLRFPLFNYRTLVDIGIDYENWRYPSERIRQLYGINIGLNYRF